MSPRGALIMAVTGIILLGGLALWLLNVPLWSFPGFAVVLAILGRSWFRRQTSRQRARQDTEKRP